MITFRALTGGAAAGTRDGFCYLLQLDNVNILLDCGLREFGHSQQEPISELSDLSHVDLVLFSHSELEHTGFYPYARTRLGLVAPAYATLPVQSLAKVAALDHFSSSLSDTLSPADITSAFEAIIPLPFTQPVHLQGKCSGLTITPFNAGHSLGGAIWKIRSPSAGTIIYAVHLNHLKERTLDGTVLLKSSGSGGGGGGTGIQIFEPLARPDLLITDASRALALPSRRKDRDSLLLNLITSTLNSRHSILIPTQLSSRLLELLVLLDQHWQFARLKYPLCIVATSAKEMLTVVSSLMEWFGGRIGEGVIASGGVPDALHGNKRKRNDENDGPLTFRHLEFFPSPASLVQTYSSRDPKLILATPLSMDYGASRAIFAESGLAGGDGNLVLLTQSGAGESIAGGLMDEWYNGQEEEFKSTLAGKSVGKPVALNGSTTLQMSSKEPLVGAELEAHIASEKSKAAAAQALERERRMLEAQVDDSDESDSDDEGGPHSDGSQDDEEKGASEMDLDGGDDAGPVAEPGGGGAIRSSKKYQEEMAYMKMTLDEESTFLPSAKGQNYDTYLKHSTLRTTSFFKSSSLPTPQQQQQQLQPSGRFKMFPYYERRRKVDAYGEEIDVGTWLRRGKELEDQNGDEGEKPDVTQGAGVGEKKEPPEPPSKVVTHSIDVQLACNLMFIDMEGLNDGRAVKTIIPQINPRKMIIINAPANATKALVDSCAQIHTMTRDVYTPTEGETLSIGQHTQSFAISLSEGLIAELRMSRFEDNEVGHVKGRVVSHENSSIPILEPISSSDTTLSSIPNFSSQTLLPQSTLIGDLKLTLLKSRLASSGINADFAGEGVLVCSSNNVSSEKEQDTVLSDVVSVKKSGKNKVFVEGMPSEVYYKVRKEIYALYAVVGA